MPQVTGIGGVFFKSKGDHTPLRTWYENLWEQDSSLLDAASLAGLRTKPKPKA